MKENDLMTDEEKELHDLFTKLLVSMKEKSDRIVMDFTEMFDYVNEYKLELRIENSFYIACHLYSPEYMRITDLNLPTFVSSNYLQLQRKTALQIAIPFFNKAFDLIPNRNFVYSMKKFFLNLYFTSHPVLPLKISGSMLWENFFMIIQSWTMIKDVEENLQTELFRLICSLMLSGLSQKIPSLYLQKLQSFEVVPFGQMFVHYCCNFNNSIDLANMFYTPDILEHNRIVMAEFSQNNRRFILTSLYGISDPLLLKMLLDLDPDYKKGQLNGNNGSTTNTDDHSMLTSEFNVAFRRTFEIDQSKFTKRDFFLSHSDDAIQCYETNKSEETLQLIPQVHSMYFKYVSSLSSFESDGLTFKYSCQELGFKCLECPINCPKMIGRIQNYLKENCLNIENVLVFHHLRSSFLIEVKTDDKRVIAFLQIVEKLTTESFNNCPRAIKNILKYGCSLNNNELEINLNLYSSIKYLVAFYKSIVDLKELKSSASMTNKQLNGNNGEVTNSDDVASICFIVYFLIELISCMPEPIICTTDRRISDVPFCNNCSGNIIPASCFLLDDLTVSCHTYSKVREVNSEPMKHCVGKCSACLNSNFLGQGNCSQGPDCNCTTNPFNRTLYCISNSMTRVCIPIQFDICYPIVKFIPPPLNPYPFDYNPYVKKRDLDAVSTISFNIPQIIVLSPSTNIGIIQVSWTYFTYNGWHTCNPGTCSFDLDYGTFLEAGSLIVKVFINDTLDSSQIFTIAPIDSCQNKCLLCFTVFVKWNCHTAGDQAFVIIFLIISMIVVLALVSLAVKFIPCCCVSKCSQSPNTVINNTYSNDDKMIELEDRESKTARFIRETQEKIAQMNRGGMSGITILVLFGFFALALGAPACSNAAILTSTQSTCLISGSIETCSFQQTVLTTLPFIGGTACIDLVSSETLSVMAKVYLTYQSSIKIVGLSHNYYTSGWQGIQASSKACYNDWGCWGGSCAVYRGIPLDQNLYNTPATQFPGITQCNAQCGCAGCGCFFCDSACIYSRYAFTPINTIYDVLTPFDTIIQPHIRVEIIQNGTSTVSNIQLAGATTIINSDFQISLIGSLAGSSTEFGARKIIVGNGAVYIGVSSETNSPQPGIPGDIQSNSISDLANPTVNPDSFKFSTQIVTPQFASDRTTYSFANQGVSLLSSFQYIRLPQVIGSTLYTYSNGQLIGTDNNPGGVLVSFQTRKPVVIKQIVNVVCPVTISISTSGCYNCIQSAQFVLTAKSSCSAGSAIVSIISDSNNFTVLTPSIILEITSQSFQINFRTSSKFIQGKLKISNGLKYDVIPFSSVLNDPVGVVITNRTNPNGTVIIGGSGFSFPDWFDGLVSPWNIIKWVVIAVIIIIFLSFVTITSFLIYYKWIQYQSGYRLL